MFLRRWLRKGLTRRGRYRSRARRIGRLHHSISSRFSLGVRDRRRRSPLHGCDLIKKNPQPISRLRTSLSQERNFVVSRAIAEQKKALLAAKARRTSLSCHTSLIDGRHCPLLRFLLRNGYSKARDSCQGITSYKTYATVRRYEFRLDGASCCMFHTWGRMLHR
jgi:hypothetical protein